MRSSVGFWLSVWFVTALACGRQQLDDASEFGSANVKGSTGSAGAPGGTGNAVTTNVLSGAGGAMIVAGSAGATNLSGAGGTTYVTGSAGATGSGGAAGGDGASDAGACGDPYANSSMPFDPCAVDSDCHSAYLFCGPPQANVGACRDADAAVDDCPPPGFADLPICPVTKMITANLCGIRYQGPCNVASDCGPGFTCTGAASTCSAGSPCGTCQAPPPVACATKADCPKEWDCYASCACTSNPQTYCFPPFETFRCPECGPTPGP